MAKLSTPRLADVGTDVSALAALREKRCEVGIDPATALTPQRVRLVLRNHDGTPTAALVAHVHPNGGWSGVTGATILSTADAGVVGRFNRLMSGFQPTYTPSFGQPAAPTMKPTPRIETFWRTKEIVIRMPGRPVTCPATLSSASHGTWFAARTPTTSTILDNATAGFSPLPGIAATAPAALRVPVTTAPSSAPAQSVTPPVAPAVAGHVKGIPTPPAINAATALPKEHPGLFRVIPAGGMTVHIEPRVRKSLDVAYTGFRNGDRTVVVLRGPSGSGKTITAQDLAARNGLPFMHVDVMALRDFADWTGSVTLRQSPDGSGVVTQFVHSMFAEAIRADGPYGGYPRLVLLDEVNRAESAGSQNALIPVLGGHETIYVPDAGKVIPIDPAVMFVATANIGALHTGTTVMDDALVNRGTSWVPVPYPSPAQEATILVEQAGIDPTVATQMVRAATQVREIANRGEIERSVSTRQLVTAARHIRNGHTPLDACTDAFVETFSHEGGAQSEYAKVVMAVNAVLR